jgi:hypothetical protein
MQSLIRALAVYVVVALARGQSTEVSADDIVELSPFTVATENEPRYKAADAIGAARVPTPLIDPRMANVYPAVGISVLKRAEAVAVQFVLSHAGDKQEARNQELYASVNAIEAAMKAVAGARVEQREVRFTGGDRRFFSVSRGGATTSFVSILVLADLTSGRRVVDRVKEIRDVLGATKLVGQTKYSDGSVGLYLQNPDQYRREILQKIFDDVEFKKKGFAGEMEILPSGLTGRVRFRVATDSELELWIDYSLSFRSIRELEGAKKK